MDRAPIVCSLDSQPEVASTHVTPWGLAKRWDSSTMPDLADGRSNWRFGLDGTMTPSPWSVKLELHAEVDLGDGPQQHFTMVEAGGDDAGHWTMCIEHGGSKPATLSGDGDRPTIVAAEGAILIVLPPQGDR